MNKSEIIMVNSTTGKETEVHVDSIPDMEAAGWTVKKGQKAPKPSETAPVVPVATTGRTPEEQAQRDTDDEGAKTATVAQLREALSNLGIGFSKEHKKADLLDLYLNRP